MEQEDLCVDGCVMEMKDCYQKTTLPQPALPSLPLNQKLILKLPIFSRVWNTHGHTYDASSCVFDIS